MDDADGPRNDDRYWRPLALAGAGRECSGGGGKGHGEVRLGRRQGQELRSCRIEARVEF